HPAPSALSTLSLHDALPISPCPVRRLPGAVLRAARRGRGRRSAGIGGARAGTRARTAADRFDPASAGPEIGVGEEAMADGSRMLDRKSTRLNSSHLVISYAV